MTKLEKSLFGSNILLCSFFAAFSYSYVDLNLTLSQNPLSLKFVNHMQVLGYYNRPIATVIFIAFITSLFTMFILTLRFFSKKKLGLKYLITQTLISVFVLTFSYPFLSSDIFNYMFDAKIISVYHASPYVHKALDFPQDDWIRFMRWVHRVSPYGPFWLGISLIPYVLGFNKFILILFNFKIFISIFHLINSHLIYKFLHKTDPGRALLGTAFYALNPLFLIEGVVNSHNDVVLATFLILPIFLLTFSNKVGSFVSLALGIFFKYIPVLNLPFLLISAKYPKTLTIKRLIILNFLTLAAFTVLFSNFRISVPFVSTGSTQVQFQPWYLFWTIPLLALIPNYWLFTLAVSIAVGSLLRYLPYIYYGDWSQPGTLDFLKVATLSPFLLACFLLLAKKLSISKK